MEMNENVHFIEPYHLISPKFDADYCRLHDLLGAQSMDIKTLEQGLWFMCSKLIDLSNILYKSFVLPDEKKFSEGKTLVEEIHDKETSLTAHLVHLPVTSPETLKVLILVPGRLERVGSLLESILNVSMLKARYGTLVTDSAMSELQQLFGVFTEMLATLRDAVTTCDKQLLDHMVALNAQLAQMILDFADAHEVRLMKGVCSPRASSLYLDILDSMRNANRHIRSITDGLMKIASSADTVNELRPDR